MAKKPRFAKSAFLIGAVAASALSLGVFLPMASADIPVVADPAPDPYSTGKSHITIKANDDSANPALYPDRFVAYQVFQGKVPDAGDDVTENTLTAITWGKSIDPDTLISNLFASDWGVGNANEDAFPTEPGVDELDYDNYKDIHSLGDLFARWCVDNVGAAAKAFSDEDLGGLENVKYSLDKDDVSPLILASFLQQFASIDDGKTEYSSPSKFTASEVAAGFAYVVSKSQAAGLVEGESQWTSYALESGMVGDGPNLARNVFNKPQDAGTPTYGWVIDTITGIDPASGKATEGAQAQGIPVGYYVTVDRLDEESYAESSDYASDTSAHHSAISELILRVIDEDGVVVSLKSDIPTVDKKIKGVDTDTPNHDASVVHTGQEVTYILTATLPENVMSYHDNKNPDNHQYMINFHDHLPGLFDIDESSLEVYVNVTGVECSDGTRNPANHTDSGLNAYRDSLGSNDAVRVDPKGFGYTEVPGTMSPGLILLDTNGSMDEAYKKCGCDLHIKIPNVFNLKPLGPDGSSLSDGAATPIEIGPQSIIYAVYRGHIRSQFDTNWGTAYPTPDLLEKAVGSTSPKDQLKNTVYLEYTNNPYTNGTGQTPPDSVQHYTFGIDLQKFENDFGEGNPTLKGAGFSFVNATADDGSMSKPSFGPDVDDFRELGGVKVARFRKYTHTGSHDWVHNYADGQDIYVFDSWAAPVTADKAYVDWYNAHSENPTSHMHVGMLAEAVDADGHIVYPKDSYDHLEYNDPDVYYQIMFTDDEGEATVFGIDGGYYTIVESLTPEAHKPLQPFTWQFKTSDTKENSTIFEVLDDSGKTVATAEKNAQPQGDAKIFTGLLSYDFDEDTIAHWSDNYDHSTYEEDVSPYVGNTVVNLQLRNITNIDLPTTGGIGTTLLYIAGAVLVIGTLAYTIYRRHSDACDA